LHFRFAQYAIFIAIDAFEICFLKFGKSDNFVTISIHSMKSSYCSLSHSFTHPLTAVTRFARAVGISTAISRTRPARGLGIEKLI
jgi:hypothetical protein